MSFIIPGSSSVAVSPLNVVTATLSTTNYATGSPVTFTLTAWDQLTTYPVSTTNGTISFNSTNGTATWTPTTAGAASVVIGNRTFTLTVVGVTPGDFYSVGGGSSAGAVRGIGANGNAGGGGGFSTAAITLTQGITYTVTVGGSDTASQFASGASASAGVTPLGFGNNRAGTSGNGNLGGFPGSQSGSIWYGGGGGGGAGGAGGSSSCNGINGVSGNGGAGLAATFYDQTFTFGGGGAGGCYGQNSDTLGTPGFGGGTGTIGSNANGANGTANTGGGAGGTGTAGAYASQATATGGSGFVWFRWVTANSPTPTITGTYTTSVVGSYTYVRWTSSGTIKF